ncbi:hypothetical protein XaC1_499 [Xanthomonas phage XaC1]|nr:hypothetical protein XaC1_499 [Xanthomonas phage XaC1]
MWDIDKLTELLKRKQEEFDNMTPEERQMDLYGYTEKQLEDYKTNSFSTDMETLTKYIEEHGTYNTESVAYKTMPEAKFINEKFLFICFNDESVEISSDDYHSTTVLNDIVRNDSYGMGSTTNFNKYEPKPDDIQYTKDDVRSTVKIGTGIDEISVGATHNDPDVIFLRIANVDHVHLISDMRKLQKLLNVYLGEETNDDNYNE